MSTYRVDPQGKRYVVVNQDTGEQAPNGNHATAAKAEAHAKSLTQQAEDQPMQKAAPAGQANLFIPLAKIDQARHQVWGYGAVEEGDVADEIMDYASSLPHFQKWSADASTRSGGKSLGNLRSMHQSLAAGRLVAFQPNDAKKGIWIGAEVVDPAEWEKVQKGVYTGFSIGGDYAARWYDPKVMKTRYTAKPIEISLVDAPCIPSATFQVVKANGAVEMRKFAPTNGMNMLKAEMPSSPSPAGTQDLGPVNWDDITVDKMPDPDLMMQVSPTNPPTGETLASRHRGVQELGTQIDELLEAAGVTGPLKKAITEQTDLMLKAAGWDESKHKRGKGGQWSSAGGSQALSNEDGSRSGHVTPPMSEGGKWMSETHKPGEKTTYGSHATEDEAKQHVENHVSGKQAPAEPQAPAAPKPAGIGGDGGQGQREDFYNQPEQVAARQQAPAAKPKGQLMTPEQMAADKAELAAADTPEKKQAWAFGSQGKPSGPQEASPAGGSGSSPLAGKLPKGHETMTDDQFQEAYAAENGIELAPKAKRGPAKAYRARMMALQTGSDAAGATKAGNDAMAPKAGAPISAEERAQNEAEGASFSTAGKPNGEHPGKALAEKWKDEPDAAEITPDEHAKIADHYRQMAEGGDESGEYASKAWEHSIQGAGKANGHRQLPDVMMTASHEHYQKTGKALPEPNDRGVITMNSSRVRGTGGMVGYHPESGRWGSAHKTNDPITGKPRFTTETGTALKNNSGELNHDVQHHATQEDAWSHLSHHLAGAPVTKALSIPIRRPLPALAKRGATPLDKVKRLVKVTSPRQPAATGEPRKIKVKP